MGISLNEGILIRELIDRYNIGGRALVFGVPEVHFSASDWGLEPGVTAFSGVRGAEVFFRDLGFLQTNFADISADEGANVILDIGTPNLPIKFSNQFDFIYDSGTLEHVFDIPNALHNIVQMLKTNGTILHIVCMNNCPDHGFYQLSPTLFYDYYEAAGFELLEAACLTYSIESFHTSDVNVRPLQRGSLGCGRLGSTSSAPSMIFFAARKRSTSIVGARPIQFLYQKNKQIFLRARWFESFLMRGGRRVYTRSSKRLTLATPSHLAGHAYTINLTIDVSLSSDASDPTRSNLLLFEDGRAIGPINLPIAEIVSYGHGAYCHWQDKLVFSAFDNSNPSNNGRVYEIVYEIP